MTRFLIAGAAPLAPGAFPFAQIRYVSPDFFRTMGLGLLRGRTFEQKDIENNANLFVVNQAFVERYLSGRDSLTSSILIGVLSPHPDKIPVIGVVSNARDLGVETDAEPELYLPGFGTHAVILLRTDIDPGGIAGEVRNAVRQLDPNQPIYHVQTIDEVLSDSLARQKVTAVLLGIFALLALTLASIGIYGVIAYSIEQRTREIGVRMAVGANRTNIVLLVLREVTTLTGIGILAGLAGALVCAHFLSTLLYQVSNADPVSIGASVVTLLIVGMLAAVVPAAQASMINPTEALRSE